MSIVNLKLNTRTYIELHTKFEDVSFEAFARILHLRKFYVHIQIPHVSKQQKTKSENPDRHDF